MNDLILFEDNHLLILDKPAGVLTQPSPHTTYSLESEAKSWIKIRDKKPGGVFLHPVHRLDQAVSGIVIFCKTQKALERMHKKQRERETTKIYHALLEVPPNEREGTLIHYLAHGSHRALIVSQTCKDARRGELRYQTLSHNQNNTLVEIELLTGRYHQIRAQFGAIGCPILGDYKYGGRHSFSEGQIALHHTKTIFLHPISIERIEIETPPKWAPSTNISSP